MEHETLTERIIQPARNLSGTLRLPGDKSISHRYAMLGGFAEGTSTFANFSTGADCASSLGCVAALGAKVEWLEDGRVAVTGVGNTFTPAISPLDCGNSGSTMRMMAGLLAAQQGEFTLVGDASLSRRPMERVRKPLAQMGAEINLTEGHAPLVVRGASLKAIDFTTPIPSAQVKTALLFAGLQADGTTTVRESVRTRDHGELALRAFGAEVARTIDSRATLLDVLTALGATLPVLNLEEKHGELVGTVQLNPPPTGLGGTTVSGALAAQLIDELPVLAAIAPYSRNGIRIRDAKELRVKESDRIALVVKNLRAMGAEVEEFDDGLDVPGGQALHGAQIDSGGDHRIAMAFSVAALRAHGETSILGAESAAISFPEFFDLLETVAER